MVFDRIRASRRISDSSLASAVSSVFDLAPKSPASLKSDQFDESFTKKPQAVKLTSLKKERKGPPTKSLPQVPHKKSAKRPQTALEEMSDASTPEDTPKLPHAPLLKTRHSTGTLLSSSTISLGSTGAAHPLSSGTSFKRNSVYATTPADLRLPRESLAARRRSVSVLPRASTTRSPDQGTLKIKIYSNEDNFALKLRKENLRCVDELVEVVAHKLALRYKCSPLSVDVLMTFPDKSLKSVPLRSSELCSQSGLYEAFTMDYIQNKSKIYLQANMRGSLQPR